MSDETRHGVELMPPGRGGLFLSPNIRDFTTINDDRKVVSDSDDRRPCLSYREVLIRVDTRASFRLQQRVGIIFSAASLFFAAARAVTQIAVLGNPLSATFLDALQLFLIAAGAAAIPTALFDRKALRLAQVGLFLFAGVVLLEQIGPGNLTGIPLYVYGILLGIRYGFFRRHNRLKLVAAVVLVVAAATVAGIRHNHYPVATAIVVTIAASSFLYLYWIVFADEINHFRLESERLRREAISNQVFIRFGQNIAGIVHNVKSKLMSIEGFNDLIAEGVAESSGETGDYAALQRRGIDQIHEMIDGLLLAVRSYQRTETETMSLGRLVRSTVEILRANRNVRSGITVELDLCKNDRIQAAPIAVIQILDALLQNAWEAVLPTTEHSVAISTRVDGSFIACTIRDVGQGLPFCTPCETDDCLVCPNFRIGRSSKSRGSGIGVIQTRLLIRDMGGKLKYESATGHGTSVTVWFPRAGN